MNSTQTHEKLRAAVREYVAGEGSQYRLAKECDCQPGQIRDFASGRKDIRFELASRIAEFLGLELAKPRNELDT